MDKYSLVVENQGFFGEFQRECAHVIKCSDEYNTFIVIKCGEQELQVYVSSDYVKHPKVHVALVDKE